MQAVILAAGMGKRLKDLTSDNAKCMIEVNGISLIERALRILDKKGLSRIVIVVGYKKNMLINFVEELHIDTPIVFIENKEYKHTNNIYSLLLAKDYFMTEDVLLLESDIIFEENIIDEILNDPRETLALVDKYASWMDGSCLEIDEQDVIVDFIPGKILKFEDKESYFKTVNIYKFSKVFSEQTYIPFLEAYLKAMGVNEYYESVIKLIVMLENCDIRAKRLSGQTWYEIDDVQDLDIAATLFTDSVDIKYEKIVSRFGGFWRYPMLSDFCYLVNPYFPTQRMMDELRVNFEAVLSQYPSGMRVNSLLAAKNFGIKQEHIVIGNGAAELIKVLMEKLSGRLGIITPTFEEYHHRFSGEVLEFRSRREDFRYSARDIINFFDNKKINHMVVINPDNPSGNYIPKEDIIDLIKWAAARQITLVVDESFVDFVDGNDMLEESLISEDILSLYDRLFVVKSISKSYGVPGLRLGVLASSNTKIIEAIKADVSIWNVNSFAEFFMQIFEKYKKEYLKSLSSLKEARRELMLELDDCENIKVFPSEANYVLCEIKGVSSKAFVAKMLENNFLIKDITDKIGNGKEYVRIAIRTKAENTKLIKCLRETMHVRV